jgi:hypothetical protein
MIRIIAQTKYRTPRSNERLSLYPLQSPRRLLSPYCVCRSGMYCVRLSFRQNGLCRLLVNLRSAVETTQAAAQFRTTSPHTERDLPTRQQGDHPWH